MPKSLYASENKPFVPNKFFISSRNAKVSQAEESGIAFDNRYLQSHYLPPKEDRFVLVPRLGGSECDLLCMAYTVDDKNFEITQAANICMIEIKYLSPQNKMLSVEDVKQIAEKVFKGSDIEVGYFQRRNRDGTTSPIETPEGNGHSWWQKPGKIGFYFLRTDDAPNPHLPTLDLISNARWYTEMTHEEANYNFWQGEDDPFIVFKQIASLHDDKYNLVERFNKSLSCLNLKYIPPPNTRPIMVPQNRTLSSDLCMECYTQGKLNITLTQTQDYFSVQLEEFGSDVKAPLSDMDTLALAQQLFLNSDDIILLTTNATASMAAGVARVEAHSKSQKLSSLHWWQDSGRVIFYLPDVSK